MTRAGFIALLGACLTAAPAAAQCPLASSWRGSTSYGSSTWTFTADGKAQESGLGNASGTASLSGRDITVRWTTSNGWNGQFVLTMSADCTTATTTGTVNPPGQPSRTVSGTAVRIGVANGPAPRLRGRVECQTSPFVIQISELPSRSCSVVISGWRRSTAVPVEVNLIEALDLAGNHSNGIEIFTTSRAVVWDWGGDYYKWGLLVFACPDKPGQGGRCPRSPAPGNSTLPGPFVVRIEVRQGEMADTALLTGTAIPSGYTGPGTGVTLVSLAGPWTDQGLPADITQDLSNRLVFTNRFGNRSNGSFLNATTVVAADWQGGLRATITDNGNTIRWANGSVWSRGRPTGGSPAGGTLVRIQNRWKPDSYLHIEYGQLTSGAIQNSWWSAVWQLEPVPGSSFMRLRNRWKPNEYIHIEPGYVTSGPAPAHWWSSMWGLDPVPGTAYVRLKNRWKPDQYLHIERGRLESSPAPAFWWSSMWLVR